MSAAKKPLPVTMVISVCRAEQGERQCRYLGIDGAAYLCLRLDDRLARLVEGEAKACERPGQAARLPANANCNGYL